jgi:hypothetical protein
MCKRDLAQEFKEVAISSSKLKSNMPECELSGCGECSNCGGEVEASGSCHFCGMERIEDTRPNIEGPRG